ncbi:hypothetical protein ACHAWO_008081 [Cyclotella atomus]|uniref:SET domain-containing protein n=1 Tax=Cyclotella atomus TaxID=382360 RepID=A0ABD3NQS4_9STRA
MLCTALIIILCLVANLHQIQSLHTAEQPTCTSGKECNHDGLPSTDPSYIAAKDHPVYMVTDDKWKEMTFIELHDHLDCYPHARNQSKAYYTEEMYNHMKAKYSELTGHNFEPLSNEQDVFHIAMSEGAGRGVFASRDIKKGEIIPFDATCSVVTFTDGQLWKEYIFSLPRTMACDVMEWTWTQNVHSMGDIRLCLSIGDGDSYLNNADIDEDINIAPSDLTSMKFEATRDIPKGEELIYDYDVFEPTEYSRFGLGHLLEVTELEES